MAKELYLFVTPPSASGLLVLDNGWRITGKDTTYAGRPAKQFTIPDDAPNGNGSRIIWTAAGMVTVDQRAVLWLDEELAWLQTDDYYLQPVPPPVIVIEPCPDPEPPPSDDPFEIIKHVYATGDFDLNTKSGCGQFTEECCKRLHDINSNKWGHIKKNPGQNQYNGHAVDAVMLLVKSGNTKAGIYDIIKSSESPEADPAFNFAGDPNPSLWYYPA